MATFSWSVPQYSVIIKIEAPTKAECDTTAVGGDTMAIALKEARAYLTKKQRELNGKKI